MSLHVITAATIKPLSLQEAKAFLRKDADDEDADIDGFIADVTDYIDGPSGILGRCLVQQTLELRLERWPCSRISRASGLYSEPARIELPCPPLASVTSIKYYDTNKTDQTLAANQYDVFDQGWAPAIIQPAYNVTWPGLQPQRPDCVRIRYVAGYASVDTGGLSGTIPEDIIGVMKDLVLFRYDNRSAPFDTSMVLARLGAKRVPVIA